jgi:drug/metabolite transporter (DMT)-like permease
MSEHQPEILDNKTPNQRFWVVIWIIVAITLVEACAQTSLKTARVKKNIYFIPLGVFFYAIVATLLYVTYKFEGMGHVNLVWSCASIVIAILIGCVLFGEPHNRYTYTAIVLAFAAIYFAHRADELN